MEPRLGLESVVLQVPYSFLVRKFNTEGPMVPERHYCIPPLSRINLEEVLHLVEDMRYFVLHAPRQTGKTSLLKALASHLNSSGQHHCVYANLEIGQTAREDVAQAMRSVLGQIGDRAETMLQDGFVSQEMISVLSKYGGHAALNITLARWARTTKKPLVLLLDEIDALQGDSLISVLRQLRAGYDQRPGGFPLSVVLCGVRDVRDYRIYSSSDGTSVTGGSAFNIKAKSLRLGDFMESEVQSLLDQHTAESGQDFQAGAVERIWALTRGQPWLVNALALETCFGQRAGRDRRRPVTVVAIDKAREALIRSRATHLDQLAAKLGEQRVRRVIEPVLDGAIEPSYSEEDLDYARDLGLIAPDEPVWFANPIYREVIPRQLTSVLQGRLADVIQTQHYVRPDGTLDLARLMRRFQAFFRDHSEHWVHRFGYREAGPQLILQAFLQRLVNSGRRIEREYGVGRLRTDLLISWPLPDGCEARHVIECKVLRPGRGKKTVVAEGLRQTAEYMQVSGADEGHLVVFDLREGRSWSERIYHSQEATEHVGIDLWGV